MKTAFSLSSNRFVSTDIYLNSLVVVVCDAHDIPFEDETFDGVIAQGLLEHVVDPYRCVQEMYRVVKKKGLVYVEVPFMQPVHAGAFDFTRFSQLGLRRLFRQFEEIGCGALAGPGGALAWAWRSFWASFVVSRKVRYFVIGLTLLTAFWWKWLDRWLISKPTAFDSSLSYYFLGRKSNSIVSDREILESYRGLSIPYESL
jgi:SAM-dependent methyltransferase